jgi:hypothetical protein
MFKIGPHDPFGNLKHKLWPKERSRVKLPLKIRNRLISLLLGGVPHTVGKLSTRLKLKRKIWGPKRENLQQNWLTINQILIPFEKKGNDIMQQQVHQENKNMIRSCSCHSHNSKNAILIKVVLQQKMIISKKKKKLKKWPQEVATTQSRKESDKNYESRVAHLFNYLQPIMLGARKN